MHTWPHLLAGEFVAALAMTAFTLVFSIFVNAPLLQLANPNRTPNPSKAPWYFLGLQELLTMFHPMVAGVTIPGMGLFVLMLAPYIDKNPSNKPEDRKFAISIFTIFLMFWAVLVHHRHRSSAARASTSPSRGKTGSSSSCEVIPMSASAIIAIAIIAVVLLAAVAVRDQRPSPRHPSRRGRRCRVRRAPPTAARRPAARAEPLTGKADERAAMAPAEASQELVPVGGRAAPGSRTSPSTPSSSASPAGSSSTAARSPS